MIIVWKDIQMFTYVNFFSFAIIIAGQLLDLLHIETNIRQTEAGDSLTAYVLQEERRMGKEVEKNS